MQNSRLSEDHKSKIAEAVTSGLDASEWELVSVLKGGLSGAVVYQIKVSDNFFAIKIEAEDAELLRTKQIMQIASEAGVCPKIYYADAENRVILMAYIKPVMAEKSLENVNKLLAQVRKLHQQEITEPWKSVSDVLRENYQHLPSSYKDISIVQECWNKLSEIQSILFSDQDVRLCHADLNPSNVLFDGKQWLFVDWQAASTQSFYYDLACVATWFYFYDEKLCQSLLNIYLERDANEIEQAKYYLMRVFTQIYFGVGFISMPLKSNNQFPVMVNDEIEKVPDFKQFLQSIGRGQVNLADPKEQQKFGFSFFREAKTMMNEQCERSCAVLRKG